MNNFKIWNQVKKKKSSRIHESQPTKTEENVAIEVKIAVKGQWLTPGISGLQDLSSKAKGAIFPNTKIEANQSQTIIQENWLLT